MIAGGLRARDVPRAPEMSVVQRYLAHDLLQGPREQRFLERGTLYPSTEGPSWGHPMLVLGALGSFLEPFCGHLLPKVDKVS